MMLLLAAFALSLCLAIMAGFAVEEHRFITATVYLSTMLIIFLITYWMGAYD